MRSYEKARAQKTKRKVRKKTRRRGQQKAIVLDSSLMSTVSPSNSSRVSVSVCHWMRQLLVRRWNNVKSQMMMIRLLE
jgi:hypothetical protein